MPVRKFRSLQEMEDALWRPSDDPSLAVAIARVWSFADRTCPRRFPPGVYRHRSVEDAQRLRDAWEAANFRAFWARRGRPDGSPAS
jgi:hypothetical protein